MSDETYDKDITVKIGDKEYEGFEVRNGNSQTAVLPMPDDEMPDIRHVHTMDIRQAEIGTLTQEVPLRRILMRLVLAKNVDCSDEMHFMVQLDPQDIFAMLVSAFRVLMPREWNEETAEAAAVELKEIVDKYWAWDEFDDLTGTPGDSDGDE